MQTTRAKAVELRTYCRPLDEGGSQLETWDQVIQRSTYEHHHRLWREAGGAPDEAELQFLISEGASRRGLVAGRTLWLGGTEYAFDRPCCQYNCAGTRQRSVYDLVDSSWLLLNGCGVGGLPEVGILAGYTTPISEFQVIPSDRPKDFKGPEHNEEVLPSADNDYTWIIRVGDSAQAWAKAFGKLLNPRARHARRLVIDGSRVRGPGGRLKGYGWISNGFGPLAQALQGVHQILNDNAGNLLDEIAIGDVFNWMGTVLSNRRAAECLLMNNYNPRFDEFVTRKDRYWERGLHHRRQSNDSVLFWSKPSKVVLTSLLEEAYEHGDPGIVNAELAQQRAPWFEILNPCFSPETLVVTSAGAVPIKELVGKTVEVWDGSDWVTVSNFRVTGVNQKVLRLGMQDGSNLRVTPYHTMILADGTEVKAGELREGDELLLSNVEYDGPLTEKGAYLKGFLVGDGTHIKDRPLLWVYPPKYGCADRLRLSAEEVLPGPSRTNALNEVTVVPEPRNARSRLTGLAVRKAELLPWVTEYKKSLPVRVFSWDRQTKLSFLAGLLDADGTATDSTKGFGYQLISTQRRLLEDVQTLLKSIGVRSTIGKGLPTRTQSMPGGTYTCQETFRLTIAQQGAVTLSRQIVFSRLVSFAERKLKYRVRSRAGRVVSVQEDGVEEKVYCCTVPGSHRVSLGVGVTTGQCFEVFLGSFCNLVSVALPLYGRNFAALEKSVYYLARANYRQTCVNLEDGVLQPRWHQSNQALRLCGVSLTGVEQASWLSDYQIRRLRNAAVCGAYSMADQLKLPRPAAITLLKPEGTRSKITTLPDGGDCAEGMHRPLGEWMFNWIGFCAADPVVPALEAAGYKILPHPANANDVLVCFPAHYSNIPFQVVDGKRVNLESAVSQLDRYLRWNTLWADHNVSSTISFDREEIPAVVDWLERNWYQGYVATAFTRRVDPRVTAKDLGHPYLPQEVVDEAAYRAYERHLRPVDWSHVNGLYDIDAGECAGGVCPVK